MSVPRKSLISTRTAVKKAIIATGPVETTESKETNLKASGLSALSMKKKKSAPIAAFKSALKRHAFKRVNFKRKD
jgi:hypothetical protein